MSFENIPLEMRERVQWVTFDIEGNKKIPYVAGNCSKAASNKPSDWRTFEEAVEDVTTGRRQHIGYAFSSSDPFVFIDLDEEQPGIFEAFDSYSQRSVSGEGIHIICRGSFEGDGRHPKTPNIGLFQNARLCLMTGDVIDGRTTINAVDEDQLQSLHQWLTKNQTSSTTTLVEVEPSTEDAEVFEKCKQRFDTFLDLWNGNAGPDHSESDHALISMLSDCTDSNEQVRRMFYSSALCRDHRREDKYVNRSLKKTRAKQEELKESFLEFASEEELPTKGPCGDTTMIDSMPEGTLKRIAQWHFSRAYYPLQECSVAVALSSAATVVGRSFQAQGNLGLNPWIILVGPTSCGKSEYKNGMEKLFNTVANLNEYGQTLHYSKMLAGKLASGEGLEDALARSKKINSYFPEFHEIYQSLVNNEKARHLSTLKEQMLLLHGQAKRGAFLKRRVKAHKEDEKIPEPVEAPCLVVSGETTPKEFYGMLSVKDVNNGWLQRFIVLNVRNESVSLRKQTEEKPIPEELLQTISDVFDYADELETTNTFVDVVFEPEAQKYLDDLEYQTRVRNFSGDETEQSLNRTSMKAFQIASLFAVWDNHKNPVVTLEQAEWAYTFAQYTEEDLHERFKNGSVGMGQGKQEAEIRALIKSTTTAGIARRRSMGIAECVVKFRDVVPYGWLKRTMLASGAFNSEKNSVDAFERCLSHMVTAGEIMRVPKEAAEEKYGKGCGPMIGIIKL